MGVQTTSSLITNGLNTLLFRDSVKYTPKDYLWAAKKGLSPFGRQTMTDFGLYNSSLGEFTSTDYVGTKKQSMWQTKWGFAHIHGVLRQSTQAVILAQMHKEGITEKSYDVDDKTGRFVYNENQDDRFYVYDADNPVKGQRPHAPQTAEQERRHALWKAHRKQLALEGGIVNNKMTRPFTVEHLQSMKHYAIRLFGAMDNSQTLAAEVSAFGRSAVTFKKWYRQKLANFYTKTHKSSKEGRWDYSEDTGEFDFIQEEFEGFVQSWTGLIKDIARLGSVGGAFGNAGRMRKENLMKSLADLLIGFLLWAAVSELEDTELYDTVLGSEMIKGMTNAISDIVPFAAIPGFIEGSPLAAVGVIQNAANAGLSSFFYAVTGDFEKSLNAGEKALNTIGVWRAGEGVFELFTK